MKFAYVENDQVKQVFNNLPESWKNISGLNHAIDDLVYLKSIGFLPVNEIVPNYDQRTQIITGPKWEIRDNEVVCEYIVLDIPEEELLQRRMNFMNRVREHRNFLLYKSDWAMVSDVINMKGPQWQSDWERYRQELRDFPSTININEIFDTVDFDSFIWPSSP